MGEPGWALQKAVWSAVTNDTGVIQALGGPHVYDDVPRRTPLPYVTFGTSEVRDWSTGCEDAHEHVMTLMVWTPARGRKRAAAIMEALRAALHERALILDGHRLVSLRHDYSEVRREEDGERLRGLVRFRALSEPVV